MIFINMQSCTSPLDFFFLLPLKTNFDQACYFLLQNATSSFQLLRPRSATNTTWSISMMQRKKFVRFVRRLLGKINTLTIRIPRKTGIQMILEKLFENRNHNPPKAKNWSSGLASHVTLWHLKSGHFNCPLFEEIWKSGIQVAGIWKVFVQI